ncbi:PDDEXK nuclease domain-containing protein [Caldimonas brevitalea]|uniref:DUF1016 domain-containing protein n=1 Tax=Caldimonas brevitalea TaxID=413882 RepID=A0A0G3BLC5_9BURK|nr:PDDEXK nuclease domain-containing protein [Caldimonas brevitalea]AKJ30222.1 hypothetical protein AAW51_3531 [Caldimonas brevitalea]
MTKSMSDALLPTGYEEWLAEVKQRIRTAQTRATIAANQELVMLYWSIGKDILARQAELGWGAKVVAQLAEDLRRSFPEARGFSRSNLMYMKAFAAAWPDTEFVQTVSGQLSWSHNVALLDKLADRAEREWYSQAAVEHGWSVRILVHQIETGLRDRTGTALTNFQSTLPAPQSELAQQLVKDPYVFDFMDLSVESKERDLENALTVHLQAFLLELGKGFAFIGRQYHREVGGQDYFIDLLFYNTRLHSYVAVDLKMDDFKPEYAGKMQFYLNVLDAQLKTERDDSSIGLILCKGRNGLVVEYALRDSSRPIGVATYQVRTSPRLPDELADILPTPQQLQSELWPASAPIVDRLAEPDDGPPSGRGSSTKRSKQGKSRKA